MSTEENKPVASGVRVEQTSDPRQLRCSFCGKRREQVKHLIAGPTPTVLICNECIALCNEILAEMESGPPPRPSGLA